MSKKYLVSEGKMYANDKYVGPAMISEPIPEHKVKFSWNSPLGQQIKIDPLRGIIYLIKRWLIEC